MSQYSSIENKSMIETGLDLNELRQAIREEYKAVAIEPEKGFHFHTGRRLAKILNYDNNWLEGIPEESIESFAGTGNPFRIEKINSGERVVDIGCGAGIDTFVAAKMVAPTGRVISVDMTEEMLAKARNSLVKMGLNNVVFRLGYAENLPIVDSWADVVISNGVLNLTPDKKEVFREINRVLKPGGRIQIADILVQSPVSDNSKRDPELWTGCVAGALLETELQQAVRAAGLVDFKITWRGDIYNGAPQHSSAANFGTMGINFTARKP